MAAGRPRHIATEQQTFEEVLSLVPRKQRHAAALMARLKNAVEIAGDAIILEIGAASGGLLLPLGELGYRCIGVEPTPTARANARRLAQHLAVPITIVAGVAESLPFKDGQFDVVLADTVIEHVLDVERAFSEACRVLRAGGVFWFYTASSLCPYQYEIRRFPLFPWYPDRLKRRIMEWTKVHRPELVGHTTTPAINWFTPWKARRLLREAGFREVYDRWDIRARVHPKDVKARVARLVCSMTITRAVADVFVPDCSYAAIK